AIALNEFDARHRRVVAVAGAELEDPRVAALTVLVARSDLVEELVGHVLVADEGHHVALPVDAALLGPCDHALGDGAEGLGLGLAWGGCGDARTGRAPRSAGRGRATRSWLIPRRRARGPGAPRSCRLRGRPASAGCRPPRPALPAARSNRRSRCRG